jgi:hypothetical protein
MWSLHTSLIDEMPQLRQSSSLGFLTLVVRKALAKGCIRPSPLHNVQYHRYCAVKNAGLILVKLHRIFINFEKESSGAAVAIL